MSLVKAEKTENANRVKLEISVDAATFEKAVEAAYRKNVKKLNIPGFRRGKATRGYIEKMYGESFFYEDAMNDVYPSALDEAIAESGYAFVEDKIDLDVTSVGKEGLNFTAIITVKPECKIDGYKGLKAEKAAVAVSDDDVEAELKKFQDRQSRLVSVEDREAKLDDIVLIDYEGFVDDVAFAGGKGENQSLTLGSGQFIPGFEEQIVGKKIGEEFDVNVTFPTEYHAEELAGKEAVFKCKLHEIKVRELPELNDDFAKDCSEFDTLDEFKADVKAKLTEVAEKEADNAFETALAEQLADLLEADIPAAMFENAMDDAVEDFGRRLQMQGLSLDMYLQYTGMDAKAFRETTREQAEKQVKVRLALETIVKNEGIEVSAEDVEAEYAKFAEQYKMEVAQIKAAIPEKSLREDLTVEKAMHFVKDNAKAGKPAAKKSTAKKAADEDAEKKPAAKKTTSTAKKPAAKKEAADGEKKPAAKKTTSTAKKPAAKKEAADGEKKPAAKKSTAKKPAAKKTEE